jgi:hypothetical protein
LDIGDIIKNSLGYPISNTKNFLILGLLILLGNLYSLLLSFGIKNIFLTLLLLLTLLIAILRGGYNLRILGSSINGSDVLPDFGNWKRMFVDGIKLFIVVIVYMIPLILILMVCGMFFGYYVFSSGAAEGSLAKIMLLVVMAIAGLYYLFVYPIILMAIANMTHKENNISYAFKLGEIRTKISDLGLGSYVGWFIITAIIYAALIIIGMVLRSVFGLVHVKFIGIILSAIIIGPFAALFLFRSASLMYRSTLEFQDEPELVEDPEAL